ncbi:MAG: ATP-binding protein [Clostridia bacterium]|nr:ATP-binding protein [Clostridia bacterium]
MYIAREIDPLLQAWKAEPGRKPLLLRGVRQCGKTSCVRNLGASFDHYIEINLEKTPSLHRLFEGDLDVRRMVSLLEIETGQPVVPGRSLLFIDEIQACPRAILALRYLYEDLPELHVIAAGSLLEFVLKNPRQKQKIDFPVGRTRSLYLYPFSFREFLRGTGQERLCEYLDQLHPETEPNVLHEKLLEQYQAFLLVGGMPEAIVKYRQTGSFLACQAVHRDIILNFRDDFGKYDDHIPGDMIRKVFDYAIRHVCSQTKSLSAIPGLSAYYFSECVSLLQKAGLVFPVRASSCDTLPLGTGGKEANQKLLFFDTGVYLTECGLDTAGLLAAEAFDEMNKGSVVEMQTGLELIKSANPYGEASLFYWYRSGANAEVDYVIEKDSAPVPVEVKASGKGSMQSMTAFLERFPDTPYGIRVSLEDFSSCDRIRVCPVYAVSRLK